MSDVQKAAEVATMAHAGQKYKQYPYTYHLHSVADQVGEDETLKTVAWLHDIIEDTHITEEDLITLGFSNDVVLAVSVLTKPDGATRKKYLRGVKKNKLATKVKIADATCNLFECVADGDIKRAQYYLKIVRHLEK